MKSKLHMHAAFLERYFDIEAWHSDLFRALLEYKTPWNWQELSDAFMQVCCHLHTPKGSASKRADWINAMNRVEWCRLECAKGEQDATKILVHSYQPALPRKKPRCSRALLKAVRWSMELHAIEKPFEEKLSAARKEAFDYFDVPDRDHKTTMRLLDIVERLGKQKSDAIKAKRKEFRLAGGKERSGS